MDFRETLETIQADDASVSRLFGGDGRGVHGLHTSHPAYQAKLAEAAQFISQVYKGTRPVRHLQEALGTSDFPLLFGDVLDRQLLATYRETPSTFRDWCRISTVSDFRPVKRFAVNGAESTLALVAEQAEYPQAKMTDAVYTYSVVKYGRQIPFSWEAILDDDLNALKDIPARFGRSARRSEEKFATGLIADANGPHASFYTVGNKNIINTTNGASATNPPLSISGLQDAMTVLSQQRDADGEPIVIDAVYLIVPPALEITAQNILHATELWVGGYGQVGGGGGAAQGLHVTNWMRNKVRLEVASYLPIVSTTNGGTSWYLVADPNGSRPAFEMGFLAGHTEPEVFIKEPNQRRVGSGATDAMAGSFETDTIGYKVRHCFGGSRLDPRVSVSSNGTNA